VNYSLRDRVLFALLVLPEEEMRTVVALLDAIAAAPLSRAQATFRDGAGRSGYVCAAVRLRLYYYVAKSGRVTFTDLRHTPPTTGGKPPRIRSDGEPIGCRIRSARGSCGEAGAARPTAPIPLRNLVTRRRVLRR
jgi:hypothetical protein